MTLAGQKVAALVIDKDESLRVAGEEGLARELSDRGLQGVASYRFVPKEELRDVDKALLAAVPAANRALFRTLLVSLAEAADRALAETEEAAAPKKPAAPVRNKPVARAAAAVRKKARNKR